MRYAYRLLQNPYVVGVEKPGDRHPTPTYIPAYNTDKFLELFRKHLEGEIILSVYTPGLLGNTRWVVVDIDGKNHKGGIPEAHIALKVAVDNLKRHGLDVYYTASKSGWGWHIWIFFKRWQPAKLVAKEIRKIVSSGDWRWNKGVDIFPNTFGNKAGNAVRLPIHNIYSTADDNIYRADHFISDQVAENDLFWLHEKPQYLPARFKELHREEIIKVYGPWLTGVEYDGWLQCRDPWSPTGDRHPSAGVSTGLHAPAGMFHSFRTGEWLTPEQFIAKLKGGAK